MKNRICILILTLCFVCKVKAATFLEIGDAGDTIETAQLIVAGIDEISGSINTLESDFLDLYKATFEKEVTLEVSGGFDSELLILDLEGFGFASDDNSAADGRNARVSLPAGSYLIGLGTQASFYLDPSFALSIADGNSAVESQFGPLIGSALLGGGNQFGFYTVSFTSPSVTIPEPSSLLLVGLSVLGFILNHNRKN